MKAYQELPEENLPFRNGLPENEPPAPIPAETPMTEETLAPKGVFVVSVTSFPNNVPVENALVKIRKSNDLTAPVLELFTNSIGRTEPILLSSPPVELSLSPSTVQPYSNYDCLVTKEDFEAVEVNDFNILEGEGSVLNVNLLPILERSAASPETEPPESPPAASYRTAENSFSSSPRTAELFVIPPHTLYGDYPPKIAESMTKPLRESGEIVLENVVIPEYIVVHDGPPGDSSAQDYYVSYKEYIKNVASCEIYATWPEQSLIANILAIQSFTLNRVYTEWYRNRGYYFTITSSTAYDQKFMPGRNIFDRISEIVDQYFASYITRPGAAQPLLTQYCDGKRTTCPGFMSQWGSKYLGDEGYYAIDILKNYYGYEIYLETAEQVAGIPQSFPGTALESGSTGNAVQTIQNQLNRIAQTYTIIPRLAVDGVYGPATEAAVRTFQRTFSLPQSGVVDYATWYKISEIYVALTRIAELR